MPRGMSEFEATPQTAHDYCSAMPDKEMVNCHIGQLINQSELKDLQNRYLQLKIEELTEQIKINRQRGNTTGTNVTRRVDTVGHP